MVKKETEVVIVGAGLAGLTAAAKLLDAGIEFHIIEGAEEVGGRVKSTHKDGFILDHGFQVFNPAYPVAKDFLDYSHLHLRKFSPGARVLTKAKTVEISNPFQDPANTFSMLKDPYTAFNMLNFGLLAAAALKENSKFETDSYSALRNVGVTANFVNDVLKPFFAGVFLEPDLATSSKFLDFVLRYFLKGNPAIPSAGMSAIPLQLKEKVGVENISLDTWVHGVSGTKVSTDAGEVNGRFLILATDMDTTSAWIGTPKREWRGVTTWYHFTETSREQLAGGKSLLQVEGRSDHILMNSIPISHAANSYAPAGKHLISSSTLNMSTSTETEKLIRHNLSEIYNLSPSDFQFIEAMPIQKALPSAIAPLANIANPEVQENVFVAGDAFTNPSINGAMESGLNAANAIIAKVKSTNGR